MAFHTASFLWTYGLPEPAELQGSTVLWAWQLLPPQTPLAGAFIQLFPASLGRSYNVHTTAALYIIPKASPGLSPRCSRTSPCTGLFQIPWVCTKEMLWLTDFSLPPSTKPSPFVPQLWAKTQSSLKRLKMSAVSSFKTTKSSWFCFGFFFCILLPPQDLATSWGEDHPNLLRSSPLLIHHQQSAPEQRITKKSVQLLINSQNYHHEQQLKILAA